MFLVPDAAPPPPKPEWAQTTARRGGGSPSDAICSMSRRRRRRRLDTPAYHTAATTTMTTTAQARLGPGLGSQAAPPRGATRVPSSRRTASGAAPRGSPDAATEPGWSHDEKGAPPAPKWRGNPDVVDAATANANASSSWGWARRRSRIARGPDACSSRASPRCTPSTTSADARRRAGADEPRPPPNRRRPADDRARRGQRGGALDAGTFAWHVDMDPAAPTRARRSRSGSTVNRRAERRTDAPPRFARPAPERTRAVGPEPGRGDARARSGHGTACSCVRRRGRPMDQDDARSRRRAAAGAEVFARAEAALLPEGEAGPGWGSAARSGEPTRFGTAGDEGAAEGHGKGENDEASE